MTTKETFEKAVADSKQLTSRPDNDTLLKLYSLYKQATEGDAPDEGPSNPFDFVGKAKRNAWTELKGASADDAMTKYVALVESLKK
ncbi:MAG: acyl-CoA-binding protein [Chitinophagales bacterium]